MRRLLAAVAAALIVSALAVGQAGATGPTPAGGIVWSQNQHVTFRWKVGGEPPAWMRAAVTAAAKDSNSSRDSKAAFLAQSDSGTSWVAYTGDIPTNWAIGYTVTYIPSSFTMRLRPQGYPLDWGTLRWCQFYDSPPAGCYDAEMIALHELGHAQTLGHPDDADVTAWTDTIMHRAPKTKSKAGWNQHAFGRCDVARLQIRYEPLTTSTRISTCLDLATNLTLTSSLLSGGPGSSATLTARLKVADDVLWPLLASEPLSSRLVLLQRRAPGGTSWSSLGSMSALDDNGRYTKTLTVNKTYDFRVVFTSPSDEGLSGSTSLIVHVTVSSGGGECGRTERLGEPSGWFYPCQREVP